MADFDPAHSALVLAAALLLDFALGDPEHLPHPVRGVGWIVARLEGLLYNAESTLRGAALTLASVCVVVSVVHGLLYALAPFAALHTLAEIYFIYAALAWRSLKDESAVVAQKLTACDLEGARHAVSRIVGRDTACLDEEAVVKATVETVGENAIDAVFAPLCYILLGSAFGDAAAFAWAFKTVSTLDSMVGYKNARYLYFGRFSARLDDVLNFIPARLGCIFMLAGGILNGYRADRNALRGIRHDRCRHASPNSAHGESVMAWLLGIELGGGGYYGGVFVPKPALGVPKRQAEIVDIERAHDIMDWGVSLFLLIPLLFALAFGGAGRAL